MSLWSRIGDAADSVVDAAGNGIGTAWDIAKIPATDIGHDIGTVFGGINAVAHQGSYLGGAALQTIDTVATQGPGGLHNAYPAIAKRNLTLGQALGAGINGSGNMQQDLDTAKKRSTTGPLWGPNRLISGTTDALASWYADPLVVGGKSVKVAREAKTVLKPGDLEALKVAHETRDSSALSTRQKFGVGRTFENFLHATDGKSSSELMQMGALRDTPGGDAVASLLANTNDIADVTERWDRKRQVLRAALGSQGDIDALKASNDSAWHDIFNAQSGLETVTDPALKTQRIQEFSARYGQQVNDEIKNFNSFNALGTKVPQRTVFDRQRIRSLNRGSSVQDHGFNNMVMQKGVFSTPLHVWDMAWENRPAGLVDLNSASEVNTNLVSQIKRMRGVDGDTAKQWADRVAGANTPAARQLALTQVEDEMFRHVAKQAIGEDLSAKQIDKLLRDYRSNKQQAMDGMFRHQSYSGTVDPETDHLADSFQEPNGDWHVRPVLSTQLANAHALFDPDEVWATLKRSASPIRAMAGSTLDFVDSGLGAATSVWKFGKLLRLGYPIRTIGDNQLRAVMVMGGMTHLQQTLGEAFPAFIANRGFKMTRAQIAVAEQRSQWLTRVDDLEHQIDQGVGDTASLTAERDALQKNLADNPLPKRGLPGKKVAPELQDHMGAGTLKVGKYEVGDLGGQTSEDWQHYMHEIDPEESFLNILGAHGTATRQRLASSYNWTTLKGGDPGYAASWEHAVNHQLRQDPVVQQVLHNGEDAALAWLKNSPEGRDVAKQMYAVYGTDRAEMVRKASVLLDGTLGHNPALKELLKERQLTHADLETAFDKAEHKYPLVNGASLDATLHKGPVIKQYDRIVSAWFKLANDKPEKLFARHPVARAFYKDHVDRMIRNAAAGKDGDLTSDDLNRIRLAAQGLAVRDMKRTLYNVAGTPNLGAGAFRFIFPFFGAFQDVMTKYGKLMWDDPSRVARLEQVWDAPNQAGLIVDENGNIKTKGGLTGTDSLVLPSIPGISDIAKWKLNKNSVNVVLQGDKWYLPGWGPMQGLAGNEISRRYPSTEGFFKGLDILPYGTQLSNLGMVNPAPGWSQTAWTALHPSEDAYKQTFAQIAAVEMMQQNLDDKAHKARKYKTQQDLLDHVDHMTKTWLATKALAQGVSPMSQSPVTKFQFYFDLAHQYQDPAYQKAHPNLLNRVVNGAKVTLTPEQAFYMDNPDYFEAMVSLSKSNVGGIKSTVQGVDATKKWSKEIGQYPEFGGLFVGNEDDGTYSGAARAYQFSTSVGAGSNLKQRTLIDGKDALNQTEAEKGWIQYQQGMAMLDSALQKRGLRSYQQAGAADLLAAKQQFTSAIGQGNSAWLNDFQQQDQGRTRRFLEAAQLAVNSPKSQGRGDLSGLKMYLQGRTLIQQYLAKRKAAGGSANLTATTNADVAEAWSAFGQAIKNQYVTFGDIYDRWLDGKDDLTVEVK